MRWFLRKIRKDFYRRNYFKKKEFSMIFNKLIFQNRALIRFYKKKLYYSFFFSNSKIHSICVIKGRSRGVYRKFKSSRFVLKGMQTSGYLPGLKKSSW